MNDLVHEADRVRRDKWNGFVGLFTVGRVLTVLAVLFILLFAIGWILREDPADKPYLTVLGGGFVFNYRVSDVFYGFTAQVEKPLATGAIVEVSFENPAGGPPLVVSKRVSARSNRYSFSSPSVRGVEAGKPYHVVIRIYDRRRKELIWTKELDFKSQVSDDIIPEKPLTVGPGYTPNPDL